MNVYNFDSGSGLEDIVRDQLRAMLPSRYSIRAATLNDRKGQSAGDFDLVIANDDWFPAIKAGATPASRKVHLPIEAAYAVIEVKQTLTAKTLDDAMAKLVSANRLNKPLAGSKRITRIAGFRDTQPSRATCCILLL
jgi:hypothetical protein